MTDVDGVDVRGGALEQAVGETTGGRSGVEHPPAGDDDAEVGQRGVELVAASADEGRGGVEQHDRFVRRDEAGRLLGQDTGDEHAAGGDGRPGLLPRGHDAPSHELGVEPAPGPVAQLAAFLSDCLPSGAFVAPPL